MLKAVILIGGPQKGTRFRPFSLDTPKPLFPLAGIPTIQHHIEACVALKEVKEILLIGYYPLPQIQPFLFEIQQQYDISVKYLQEFAALGTAGGLFHFRDQIRSGGPEGFFVMNGDVCADFPLRELYEFHKQKGDAYITVMGTEATRQQSLNFGCMVMDKETQAITHYVEKPSSYVSTLINCGVYVFSLDVFVLMGEIFNAKQSEYYRSDHTNVDVGFLQLENDILTPLAGSGKLYVLQVNNWWSQLKTAGSAIYANRHYLALYHSKHPERLYDLNPSGEPALSVTPDVYIHPSAKIHPTAKLGPNVSIGPRVSIGPGVRIRESIILENAVLDSHSLILYSVIGQDSRVGRWSRVEGTPSDPDPNKPFAKMENLPLFSVDGRLNPSITILGCSVSVPSEKILLNSIVLPHKELTRSFKNEIIL